MISESPFTTGGPVYSDKTKIYIRRSADEHLFKNCLAGEYSVVLTARQMGKTSLLQHTMEELREQGVAPVFIDLNSIGTGGVTAIDWYKSILQIISESLNFRFDIETWWEETSGSISVKFAKFLTDIVVQKVDKNIVIFIDEIELTTQLEFSDSFFAVIRSMYSARGTNKILKRLSFVLVGMARISDLIRQPDITTFNIGKRIELKNFSSDEILPLVKRITNSQNNLSELTSWIMEWTGGQPYLTQLVCETLSSLEAIPGGNSGKEQLDNTVRSLLSQSEIKDKHFSTIQRYLIEKPSIVFGVYALILDGEKVRDLDALSDLQYLKLAGIVKADEKRLVVANRIYYEALGLEWLGTQLKRRKLALDLDMIIKTSREALLNVNQLSSQDQDENITLGSADNTNFLIENDGEKAEEVQENNPKKIVSKTRAGALGVFSRFGGGYQKLLILLFLIVVSALIVWYLLSNIVPITSTSTLLVSILSWVIVFLMGIVVIFIFIIVGGYISSNSERRKVEKRLAKYLDDENKISKDAQHSVIPDWASKREEVERISFGNRVAHSLSRADLKLKVGEYFVLVLIAIIAGGFFTWFIGNKDMISAGIGAIAGAIAPGMYVNLEQNNRLRKFNNQLSDMLNLMVNGLRTGYSIMQSMEAISKELPPPISDEFRRVLQEIQIGIPMEIAFENLLRRIPSEDLYFVVTVINIQREVGGNFSEVLGSAYTRLRDRRGTLLQYKRLSGPSFLFIIGSSVTALILHYIIFPNSFNVIENNNALKVLLLSIMGAWGFILALVFFIQMRRDSLLNEL